MPMHRKNSSKGAQRQPAHGTPMKENRWEASWFAANRLRSRRRNAIAAESRKRNR